MGSITTARPSAQYDYDVGLFEYPVSTSNAEAQTWFNRGIIWSYAFNHVEATACFEECVRHDPSLVMGYWGIAYAAGPHYNKSWAAMDAKDLKNSLRKCREAAKKGKEIASTAPPAERALMEAIPSRIPSDTEHFQSANVDYANAMRKVYEAFGQNELNVAVLFADALMNTAPWQLFEARTGKPNKKTPVLEILKVLNDAINRPHAREHPGLLHLYIHALEMSTTPEAALIPGDQLRPLVPDGGHLRHMASHIYILVGDYRQAMEANMQATIADDKFFARNTAKQFYGIYRLHNFHSLIYAAMLAGRASTALDATDRMEAVMTLDFLQTTSPPLADWAEFFNSVRPHVYIRFGMWDEIKKMRIPENQEIYAVTIATIYYARGIAFAATGDVDRADKERGLYREALKRVPYSRLDFPNRVVDELKVATAMLDGEIEYRRGNFDAAFKHLRLAIEADDTLVYSEPWGWMIPTRQSFGALSLEQGHVEDALNAYAEDLGLVDSLASAHQHPKNIWSLQGYHQCLERLGRKAEARIIQQELTVAKAVADISVETSCFCAVASSGKDSGSQACPKI